MAKSVYPLPHSNDEFFGIKLLSFLIYGFLMVLLPFAYVTLTTYASIAGYLPEITSNFITDALTILTFLRDAYYTGVAYGLVDLDRLIRNLHWDGEQLVVLEKGVIAAQNLLLVRSMMYPMVYSTTSPG